MSEAAKDFIDGWISENVNPTGYEPEGDSKEAHRLAFSCWEATDREGYGRSDVDVAVGGDLIAYMAEALENVNDEEVARLAAKDD